MNKYSEIQSKLRWKVDQIPEMMRFTCDNYFICFLNVKLFYDVTVLPTTEILNERKLQHRGFFEALNGFKSDFKYPAESWKQKTCAEYFWTCGNDSKANSYPF